jgi:hypothetical protein
MYSAWLKTFDRVISDALAKVESGGRASHAASQQPIISTLLDLGLKRHADRSQNWVREATILVGCSGRILSNPA